MDEEQIQEWQAEAAFSLDEGDFESAQEAIDALKSAGHASWYELQALLYRDTEELDQAIETLRAGVEVAPHVWELWQLLGNCLSDQSDFEGALDAYDNALRNSPDLASVQFNRAICYLRLERQKDALEALEAARDEIKDGQTPALLGWRIHSTSARTLAELRRRDDFFAAIPSPFTLARALDAEIGSNDELMQASQVVFDYAAGFALLEDRKNAEIWVTEAIEIDRTNESALGLWRELSGAPLCRTYFQIILSGHAPPDYPYYEMDDEDEDEADDEELGFFTTLTVVAPTEKQARELALAFELRFSAPPLKIEEVEGPLGCDEQPIGVAAASPHNLFPLDDPPSEIK